MFGFLLITWFMVDQMLKFDRIDSQTVEVYKKINRGYMHIGDIYYYEHPNWETHFFPTLELKAFYADELKQIAYVMEKKGVYSNDRY